MVQTLLGVKTYCTTLKIQTTVTILVTDYTVTTQERSHLDVVWGTYLNTPSGFAFTICKREFRVGTFFECFILPRAQLLHDTKHFCRDFFSLSLLPRFALLSVRIPEKLLPRGCVPSHSQDVCKAYR